MFSIQMIHCSVDSLTGLLACSCCALIVAILCCSSTFESPWLSSTSLRSTSSTFFDRWLDCDASVPVFLLFAGLEGTSEWVLERLGRDGTVIAVLRCGSRGVGRLVGGISSGDESRVRSTKPSESWPSRSLSSLAKEDMSDTPDVDMSDEDQKLSRDGGAGGLGRLRMGGDAGMRCGSVDDAGGGRPDELEIVLPLGSVARGKLGKSRCERFLSKGTEVWKLKIEEFAGVVLLLLCC